LVELLFVMPAPDLALVCKKEETSQGMQSFALVDLRSNAPLELLGEQIGDTSRREIHVRLKRRKRLQATKSKNLPREISAFDDVSPEVQSQPRDGVTMNGGLVNSFCLSYLRKFSRWMTAP